MKCRLVRAVMELEMSFGDSGSGVGGVGGSGAVDAANMAGAGAVGTFECVGGACHTRQHRL